MRCPRISAITAIYLTSLLVTPMVLAQSFPTKPLRIIVPSGLGGPADTSARAFAQALTPTLGQAIVVENRGGADGVIGIDACAKSAPDGYTLCITQAAPITTLPFLSAKLPYDPPRDLAPVILIGTTAGGAIVVPASLPVTTMRELVGYAKANPGKLNWGSWGNASNSYLHFAWTQKTTGTTFTHVPYKTPDLAVTAVVAGEIQVLLNTPSVLAPHIKSGKIRALALSSNSRSADLPGVPTLREQGFDLAFVGWNGVFVPAGTPTAIIRRLNAEFNKLISDAGFSNRFLKTYSVEAVGGSAEDFENFLKNARDVTSQLIKTADIRRD
jgi:tripartite-type tricarboxylate transporter receptor subunit TctC